MENHHIAATWALLMDPCYNFLAGLPHKVGAGIALGMCNPCVAYGTYHQHKADVWRGVHWKRLAGLLHKLGTCRIFSAKNVGQCWNCGGILT